MLVRGGLVRPGRSPLRPAPGAGDRPPGGAAFIPGLAVGGGGEAVAARAAVPSDRAVSSKEGLRQKAGMRSSATSAAFLKQLRADHPGPLVVSWDNGPAYGGDAVRDYLATPDLGLRLVRLPAYSPDFNPDEAIWAWAREEVTANTCLGSKAAVQEQMQRFFVGLSARTAEVQSRCRRKLQALAEALVVPAAESPQEATM